MLWRKCAAVLCLLLPRAPRGRACANAQAMLAKSDGGKSAMEWITRAAIDSKVGCLQNFSRANASAKRARLRALNSSIFHIASNDNETNMSLPRGLASGAEPHCRDGGGANDIPPASLFILGTAGPRHACNCLACELAHTPTM